jgi:hypothetical protein
LPQKFQKQKKKKVVAEEEKWILRVEAVVVAHQKNFLFLEKDLPAGEKEKNWKSGLKITHLPFGGKVV